MPPQTPISAVANRTTPTSLRPFFCQLLTGLLLLAAARQLFAQQPAKLAIIIDDVGYNFTQGERAVHLPGKVTLSVLPFTPHGVQFAEQAHQLGKEIMLHAPMSNERHLPLGKGGLVEGMSQAEFLQVLRQDLDNIPHVRGLNNHMGSLLTQDYLPMSWLMEELKARQLYFVDSRTTPRTLALKVARQAQVPGRKRDVFLDDERTQAQVTQQLILALTKARRQGSAIAIGHPYKVTMDVLEQMQPLLLQYQVELVSASSLMPAVAPPAPALCPAPPRWLWPRPHFPVNPMAVPKNLFQPDL